MGIYNAESDEFHKIALSNDRLYDRYVNFNDPSVEILIDDAESGSSRAKEILYKRAINHDKDALPYVKLIYDRGYGNKLSLLDLALELGLDWVGEARSEYYKQNSRTKNVKDGYKPLHGRKSKTFR